MLLMYTKNLSLTYHNCEKSLFYYIEFIGQIGDDNHSFLQLSSKDAILFIYKKTIFDINNEYRKEFASIVDTCDITTNIDLLIKIYYNYISIELRDFNFTSQNKMTFNKSLNISCNKLTQNILNLSLNLSDADYTKKLVIVNKFNDLLPKHIVKKNIYAIIFTKRLKKRNISLSSLENKFCLDENEEKIRSLTPAKYINWLMH